MTGGILLPSEQEISKYLLDTLRHVFHVEYFRNNLNSVCHLNIGALDPELPHDIVGPGNKLEWDVIRGLAMQFRTPKVDFETYILPALTLHRQQYHHRMWNEPGILPEDLLLGTIDATCSQLEDRHYQGGSHSFSQVMRILDRNVRYQIPWTSILVPNMAKMEQPSLEKITSIKSFPNIGVPELIYEKIVSRAAETISMLQQRGYALK